MNRAMHDLLDTTLDSWYSYLASWQAPGADNRADCAECAASPFSGLAGLENWPHDIVHALVAGLTAAVRHVALSLEELDEARSIAGATAPTSHDRAQRWVVLNRHAEAVVLVWVRAREAVMRDVLEQCVEPALDEYLRVECERGLAQLFATGDHDRPVY